MSFSLDRYKFYHYIGKDGKETIAAISRYAGKTVKGYAKCNPLDSFDEDRGKELAAARCNAKIAKKRHERARKKLLAAQVKLEEARKYYANMSEYLEDARNAESVASFEVLRYEQRLK
jgi:hypothetical protein